jgi:UPF0716 protein FxsA
MLSKLLPLLILVLLIELALLIYVGFVIGALYTMLIVLITGVIGVVILRKQGAIIPRKIRSNFEQGILPTEGIVDGVLVLLAAVLLITPGMIMDVLGFTLLVPQVRRFISNQLRAAARRRFERGQVHYWRVH